MQDRWNAFLGLSTRLSKVSESLIRMAHVTPEDTAAHAELDQAAGHMKDACLAMQNLQDVMESEDNARN